MTDVYDEFAYGQKTPFAIRDFLRQAALGWRKPPRYVLLAGDASFDPRNYLGEGDFDLVPAKLVRTAYMKTDSDDWYVDWDGDGLPELAIGRLPARTADEAGAMVAKVLARDAAASSAGGAPEWARRVLLVTGPADEYDFPAANERLRALLPPGVTAQEVAVGPLGPAAARGEIVSRWNAGQLVVNFAGHGSTEDLDGALGRRPHLQRGGRERPRQRRRAPARRLDDVPQRPLRRPVDREPRRGPAEGAGRRSGRGLGLVGAHGARRRRPR